MSKNLFGIMLIGLVAFNLTMCSKEEAAPDDTARIKAILTQGGAWSIQSVTIDGTDNTSSFASMTVTFTESGFTTSNGGVVWPASGTWQFTDNTATSIKRNDNLVVTINQATENQLVLTLTWTETTLGPGRVSSISGQHVFSFSRP